MVDKLPPGVISKPDALEKYEKPERTFQRRLSKALSIRDDAFLAHFYLATSDGVVRPGLKVGEGEVERLKGEGLYPVWHVEEEWFKNEYGKKSQRKAKEKREGDSTAGGPAPMERPLGDPAALVSELQSLRRELSSQKSHAELLTNQLEIKDSQIKAANEREQQTNILMKDLHALMGDLQQRLPLPAGNALPSPQPKPEIDVKEAAFSVEGESKEGSRGSRQGSAPRKKRLKTKQSNAPAKNTKGDKPKWNEFPTFKRAASRFLSR